MVKRSGGIDESEGSGRVPAHRQPTHQQTRSGNEPPQEPRQHPQDAAKTDVKVKKKNFYLQNWYLPTKRRISEESEILPGVQRIPVRSSFTPLGDALTGRFRRDEEKQEDSDDLDTLGGNTTVVEAEPVADSERYTEIERRIQRRLDEAQERQVEEEVQRRIRAQTKDANEVFGARGRAGDGGNRPVLATPVETEERIGEANNSNSGRSQMSRRTKRYIICLFVVFVVLALAVVIVIVIVFFRSYSQDSVVTPSKSPTLKPTRAPSASSTETPTMLQSQTPTMLPSQTPSGKPTKDRLLVLAEILGIQNLALLSETAPEVQALSWMAYQDPLRDILLGTAITGNGTISDLSE